ncbi:MAG: hypothetical protein ABSF59_11765 [Candidatus Sulfotelmatobacter sp.]|jgi:hypothetical protein
MFAAHEELSERPDSIGRVGKLRAEKKVVDLGMRSCTYGGGDLLAWVPQVNVSVWVVEADDPL